MGNVIWNGGASSVTQLNTQTVALTWASADTLRTTLTDEAGAEQYVESIATGSDKETQVRDIHHADLDASTQSLFTQITWAKSGTVDITATAKTSGRPFTLAVIYTTASTGTYADVATTASLGPNDINTVANFSTGSKPVADDEVTCNNGSYDILYGLDQSGVDLQSFKRTKDYKGQIGDPVGGFYLKYGVSNTSTTTPQVAIDGTGGDTMLAGLHDNVLVRGGKGSASMLKLTGTSTTTNMDILPSVNGQITVANGTYDITNLYCVNPSGRAKVVIGSSSTVITLHEQTGGVVEITGRGCTVADCGGGSLKVEGTVAWGTINARKGSVDYRVAKGASAALTTLNGLGAAITLGRKLVDDQTITNATMYDGSLIKDETDGRVIHTNPINQKGGDIQTLV